MTLIEKVDEIVSYINKYEIDNNSDYLFPLNNFLDDLRKCLLFNKTKTEIKNFEEIVLGNTAPFKRDNNIDKTRLNDSLELKRRVNFLKNYLKSIYFVVNENEFLNSQILVEDLFIDNSYLNGNYKIKVDKCISTS